MVSNRTIKIGQKTFVIANVPDDISDMELKRATILKYLQTMNHDQPQIGYGG